MTSFHRVWLNKKQRVCKPQMCHFGHRQSHQTHMYLLKLFGNQKVCVLECINAWNEIQNNSHHQYTPTATCVPERTQFLDLVVNLLLKLQDFVEPASDA